MMKYRFFLVLIFSMSSTALFSQMDPEDSDKPDSKEKPLRFVVIGDWGRQGEYHQMQTAKQLAAVSDVFKPLFIVSTGDNFYPNGVVSTRDYNWISSFESIYTESSLYADWYPVLGNHDYKGDPQAEVDYSKVDRRWNMPARYYSKIIFIGKDSSQAALLIFFDSTPFLSEYYEGDEHHVRGQDTAAQRIWLEKTLAEAPSYVKWKFAFAHHPMWTGGGRMKALETAEMKRIFRPIFEKYKVNVYFSGHDHNLQHIKPPGFTNYFVSGAGSETTKVIVHPEGGKFAKSVNGFLTVSVYSNRMQVAVVSLKGQQLYTTTIDRVSP